MPENKKTKRKKAVNNHLAIAATQAGLTEENQKTIRAWLAELLVADEFAKLGQGGHTKGEVPLRRVFVDLPATNDYSPKTLFLRELLSVKPVRLRDACRIRKLSAPDADSTDDVTDANDESINFDRVHGHHIRYRGAILLIGGPGQGKSTLGQLACQLHRATLLKPYLDDLSTRERDVLSSFKLLPNSKKDPHELVQPCHPLLPLHVALPDLAAWLAKVVSDTGSNETYPSIVRFIANLPSAQKCGLSMDTLLSIAGHLPFLLVFDGFDEVGATSDRQRIVAAIRELLFELSKRNASAQVLATTRPQGYAGELADIGLRLQIWHLMPLEREDAMAYARKLVEAKIGGIDAQKRTIERLEDAARRPSTARLLTTPLQVTIVTALVQQGRAPRERWRLFYSYFDYTYKREIERETYASTLLADYRAQIESIHGRVALLLQVAAERDGGATARMSREELLNVVNIVLDEDGLLESRERADLAADILKAAGQRLVFLVEPEPNNFGFEIRSLQEFLAAWALSSGPEVQIQARLRQVVKAPMFRNVLLFVASRFYSDNSHLRDIWPGTMCDAAEEGSGLELSKMTRAGALLALETLEEGAVLNQPKQAIPLMQRAASLLDLPAGDEHRRLARIESDEVAPTLELAIEEHIRSTANGSDSSSLAAWICLLEADNRRKSWARRLGDIYWDKMGNLDQLIYACVSLGCRVGPWLASKLASPSSEVSLDTIVNLIWSRPLAVESSTWLGWVQSAIQLKARGHSWHLSFVPLRSDNEQSEIRHLEPVGLPPSHPWAAVIAVAKFSLSPSLESLCVVLEEIANKIDIASWETWALIAPWPIAACLRAAEETHDLQRFATAIRLGQMGDVSDWLSSQSNWLKNKRSMEHRWTLKRIIEEINLEMPWNPKTIEHLPPFMTIPEWRFQSLVSGASRTLEDFELAAKAFNQSKSTRKRRKLAKLCLMLFKEIRIRQDSSIPDPVAWLDSAPEGIIHLMPRPRSISRKRWMHLMDGVALKSGKAYVGFLPSLMQAFIESKGHPLTRRLFVASLEHWSPDQLSVTDKAASLIDQVRTILRHLVGETATVRAELDILRIFVGEFVKFNGDLFLSDMCSYAVENNNAWDHLIAALRANNLPPAHASALAVLVFPVINLQKRASTEVVALMRTFQQSQRSELYDQTVWDRLALPLPRPISPTAITLIDCIPAEPTIIQSIDLSGVRGIQRLAIEFAQPPLDSGQWIVLLGPNGVGKTTILRSLAIALRNTRDPSIWPDDVFRVPWTAEGAEEARISVVLRNGVVHQTSIRDQKTLTVNQVPEQNMPRLFPLFAYGCRRGSALGGNTREVNIRDDGGPEVATLFNEGKDLIQAETWLLVLEGDSSKSVSSHKLYEAVISGLKRFLDLSDLTIENRRIWVTEPSGNRVLFDALSDGYLTSAGWFLDLVARWIEFANRCNMPLGEDFLSQMTGLVLIDEFDLHLHPKWQIEVIGRTRELLPRMSFVVTTHNPLTLVGGRAEEIWILTKHDQRVEAHRGTDTPMLLSSGQIYRRYFGIEDIYPCDYGRKLQRYGFLSGYSWRNDNEQAELETLREELINAGLEPGWKIVERTVAAPLSPAKKKIRSRRTPKGD